MPRDPSPPRPPSADDGRAGAAVARDRVSATPHVARTRLRATAAGMEPYPSTTAGAGRQLTVSRRSTRLTATGWAASAGFVSDPLDPTCRNYYLHRVRSSECRVGGPLERRMNRHASGHRATPSPRSWCQIERIVSRSDLGPGGPLHHRLGIEPVGNRPVRRRSRITIPSDADMSAHGSASVPASSSRPGRLPHDRRDRRSIAARPRRGECVGIILLPSRTPGGAAARHQRSRRASALR